MAADRDRAQTRCVKLGDTLTVAHAAEVRQKLLAGLADSGDLTLDPTALQEVDAAGLQLLWATYQSCRAAGKQLHMQGSNDVLDAALAAAGLCNPVTPRGP